MLSLSIFMAVVRMPIRVDHTQPPEKPQEAPCTFTVYLHCRITHTVSTGGTADRGVVLLDSLLILTRTPCPPQHQFRHTPSTHCRRKLFVATLKRCSQPSPGMSEFSSWSSGGVFSYREGSELKEREETAVRNRL